MGIDIYLRHRGFTDEQKKLQYTGFSIVSGHLGYLREAYHGPPYATKILVPESFEFNEPYPENTEEQQWHGYVHIPASKLRARLPRALEACAERYKGDRDLVKEVQKSFTDFVELAEKWELEGKTPLIYASW